MWPEKNRSELFQQPEGLGPILPRRRIRNDGREDFAENFARLYHGRNRGIAGRPFAVQFHSENGCSCRLLPIAGASGRRSGVRAETLTDTFVRGNPPLESLSSTGRAAHDLDWASISSSAWRQRAA